MPLYAYAAACIRAHSNSGGKGTKKIPHMQAYAGKSAKKVNFVTKNLYIWRKSSIFAPKIENNRSHKG